MPRIAILGATGYTALELIKLLLRHPEADITVVTSRQPGEHIASVHPQLTGRLDLHLEKTTTDELSQRADCVFSCLPHAASAAVVAPLVDAGVKVVDFSADYRLRNVATYEEWYGGKHPDPARVGKTVYGLRRKCFEFFGKILRKKIKKISKKKSILGGIFFCFFLLFSARLLVAVQSCDEAW